MVTSIFIGLLFLIFGFGFLLQETMDFEFIYYVKTYWPSLIILLGVVKLFDRRTSRTGALFLILIGALFQANYLNYIDVDIWRLLIPILLILIGISVMIPSRKNKDFVSYSSQDKKEKTSEKRKDKKFYNASINKIDLLRETIIFSGSKISNQSDDFKGGTITTIFGSYELDLRDSLMKEESAYLDISILFGSVDIWIPENWRLEISSSPIFGSWDNYTQSNPSSDAPVLKIRGPIIFGSLDVR